MSQNPQKLNQANISSGAGWNEIDVGTKKDDSGVITYHVLKNEGNIGYFVEKFYGPNKNLVKIVKRGRQSRSETDFNSETGDVERIFEASNLPDGSSMTKEITYQESKTIESILVVDPEGTMKSTVQRESIGIRTIFQGQTNYKADGVPDNTISHYMNPETGKLEHREQVKWLKDGQRTLTEHFYFSNDGKVNKYTKMMYHACGGPFLEETHRYGDTGHMLRKEIIQYNPNGVQTAADVTMYDISGQITHRSTTYYDHRGSAIHSHEEDCAPISFNPQD